jgi:hypothetical protein
MSLQSLKWFGTTLCLVGIALTSFNIYPLNIVFGLVGSALWTMAGYVQDDTPLLLVELVATLMYAAGLVTYVYLALVVWF